MYALKLLHAWFFLIPFAGQSFNYDNPTKWFFINRQCLSHKQSPIALFDRKAFIGNLAPISFEFYCVPISDPIEVTNNGHTVHVKIGSTINGQHPSITGGGVDDIYEVEGFHFHWGSPNKQGSEHVINNQRYDLEMHIVHKNKNFTTMEEAIENPFGLVVLGILFKGTNATVNTTGLNAIYDALPYLSEYKATHLLSQSIEMQSILGDLNTERFFTYRGSLTTPPCSEAVTWFVFPDVLPIEMQYLKRFWNLHDSRGLPLLNNFRPLQPNFGRRVYLRKSGQ